MDKPLPRKQRVLNKDYLYSRSEENNKKKIDLELKEQSVKYLENIIKGEKK